MTRLTFPLALLVIACGGSVELDDISQGESDLAAASQLVTVGGDRNDCSPLRPYMCLDQGWGVAAVPISDGSMIIGGDFYGTVRVGSVELSSTPCKLNCPQGWPASDIFIAKIAKDGAVEWARAYGGADNDWLYGVAVDASGSIYITGSFALPVTLGATTVTSNGSVDFFVAKLDSAGNPLWATSGGSPTYDYPHGLALAGDRVVITGATSSAGTFGSFPVGGSGDWDVMIASLDAGSGNVAWARGIGGPGTDRGRGIATTKGGDLLVTGSISSGASFGASPAPVQGGEDAFVARFDAAGTTRWVTTLGSSQMDLGESVAVDHPHRAIFGGTASASFQFAASSVQAGGGEDGFAAAVDLSSGAPVWARGFATPGLDGVKQVATDAPGRIYVAGRFEDELPLGSGSLKSAGSTDVFLARLDKNGIPTWAMRAGGALDDSARGLAITENHWLHVAGRYRATADFGGYGEASDGVSDAFFWKLRVLPPSGK